MRDFFSRLYHSPTVLCGSVVAVLAVAYIGLIAVVMSYAALTMEFSQSVKDNGAAVAALENRYLTALGHITGADYRAEGYAAPQKETFVPAKSVTALR